MRRNVGRRLLALLAVVLVCAASAVGGEMLFWSAWFVVWACAHVGAGILAEVYIRRHARTRGWDQADRPVMLRPVAWSLGLVAMSALMGSGHSSMGSSVPLWIFLAPFAWRERRRGRAWMRGGEAGRRGKGG